MHTIQQWFPSNFNQNYLKVTKIAIILLDKSNIHSQLGVIFITDNRNGETMYRKLNRITHTEKVA